VSAISKSDSRPTCALVALAACCWLAGCAGSAERSPECKGKSVPINRVIPVVGATGRSVNPAIVSTAQVSEADAH
jgi:hypothetical protein